jgi:hypothetical protein
LTYIKGAPAPRKAKRFGNNHRMIC